MNTSDMYDKTASGKTEITDNGSGLSMMERRVLILINGENDTETLAKLSLCDDIGATIDRLIELGLIEATETTVVDITASDATEETVAAFRRELLSGCIVTKVDESGALGEVLSALIHARLPIAYVSDGQQVPDDLHLASADDLVRRGLALMSEAVVPVSSSIQETPPSSERNTCPRRPNTIRDSPAST